MMTICCKKLKEREFSAPVPRKQVSTNRTIYLLRLLMRPNIGPLLLADFGEASIGPGPHAGDIMPLEYWAPETLHYFRWSYPVDIWSVGLTVFHLVIAHVDLRLRASAGLRPLRKNKLYTARDAGGFLYDSTAHCCTWITAA